MALERAYAFVDTEFRPALLQRTPVEPFSCQLEVTNRLTAGHQLVRLLQPKCPRVCSEG